MVYNADDPASEFAGPGLLGDIIPYGLAAETRIPRRRAEPDPQRNRAGRQILLRAWCSPHRAARWGIQRLQCPVRHRWPSTFGVTPGQAAAALARTHVPGRLEVVPGLPGRTFVVDYAHNGLALSAR